MYALAVRQADGRMKIEMGDDIHLDPVNGGFVFLMRHGSSVGFPIGHVECVANSSQFDMLTDNQKKVIALGKVEDHARRWFDNQQRFEREGESAYSKDEVRAIGEFSRALIESLRPERERSILEAKSSSS